MEAPPGADYQVSQVDLRYHQSESFAGGFMRALAFLPRWRSARLLRIASRAAEASAAGGGRPSMPAMTGRFPAPH